MNDTHHPDAAQTVSDYYERWPGIELTPITHGWKSPVKRDWASAGVAPASMIEYAANDWNIGLVLGASNIIAVDVDIDDVAEAEPVNAYLRSFDGTAIIRSRYPLEQGRRTYLFVAPDEPMAKITDIDGVEVLAFGQQTILPPSVIDPNHDQAQAKPPSKAHPEGRPAHPGGAYIWERECFPPTRQWSTDVEDELRRLTNSAPRRSQPEVEGEGWTGEGSAQSAAADNETNDQILDRLFPQRHTVLDGERHNLLVPAAHSIVRLVGVERLRELLTQLALSFADPLDLTPGSNEADEFDRIVKDTIRWRRERGLPMAPGEHRGTPDPVADADTDDDRSFTDWLSCSDLLRLPPASWFYDGIIPSTGLVFVYGAPGAMKSYWLQSLLWAATCDHGEFLGQTVEKGRSVAYMLAEGITGTGTRRLPVWIHANDGEIPPPDRFTWQRQSFKFVYGEPGTTEVFDYTEANSIDVLVVDTLNRFTPGLNENDAMEMGLLINTADRWQQAGPNRLAIVVHHTPVGVERLRGSGSLAGAADTTILVKGSGDGARTVKVDKQKDGERKTVRFSFTLEPVDPADPAGPRAPLLFAQPTTDDEVLADESDDEFGLPHNQADYAHKILDHVEQHGHITRTYVRKHLDGVAKDTRTEVLDWLCDHGWLEAAEHEIKGVMREVFILPTGGREGGLA